MNTQVKTKFVRAAVVVLTTMAAAACGHASSTSGQASSTSGPAQGAPASADAVTVPAQLAVPGGQQLVGTFTVDHGSQVYTCSNGAWKLLEPAAVMKSGALELLHTAGPEWVSPEDGSAVTGTQVASVPVSGAVPELLLRSSANRGDGLLGGVDYIQRLDTHGGVAPSGPCAAGAQRAVNYTAQYRFYAPGSGS
jgi:hypothetical protein